MSTPLITPLRTPGRAPRVLTIDAEEWFHVCGDDYYSDPRRWRQFTPRFERMFLWLLDTLDRGKHRATVFLLGWIAERYPDLAREAARRGHEIGLHGDLHRRADEVSRDTFREDLRRGRERIEAACGVLSVFHRAAEWSIRSPRDPALAVLAAEGFVADASMTAMPPLGRAENLLGPHRIDLPEGSLIEAPPLTGRGFGRRIPAGGAWAFRLLPARHLAASEESYRRRGHPAVFTFHPWEFDPEHPPMEGLPALVRLVHFAGRTGLAARFEAWLARERCVALGDALRELTAA
ncbi:MAG TPA: polysaccharide deacetylase family protein [Thermoanaerobaculia bacterium]|nr:polysaccharide deacetylase family protein [Thermoanaerobaculia bacterium]